MSIMDKVKDTAKDFGDKAQKAAEDKLNDLSASREASRNRKQEEKSKFKVFSASRILGDIEIDMEHHLFKIRHAQTGIKEKSGLLKKSGKAFVAASTLGGSILIEKALLQPDDIIFDFCELSSYELFEDDFQVTKGGLGLAAAGGILFGGIGAVVGGITGKRTTKKTVNSLYLKIELNDIEFPCVMIPYITKATKTKSKDYIQAFNSAQETISCLNIILKSLDSPSSTSSESPTKTDSLEQIKKLKELLDIGAITQEEFDIKKKEFLSL